MPLSISDRTEFLKVAGWSGATETPVGEDWSQRKMFRVTRNNRTAIVVQAVPDHLRTTPGHRLGDFVNVAVYLKSIEVSVPDIYAADIQKGLLLVEDFGTQVMRDLIAQSSNHEHDMYLLMTDTLAHIYDKAEFVGVDLPDYYKTYIHQGRRRVVDWYLPAVLGRKNEDGLVEEFLDVFRDIEKSLPPAMRRFQHGDYHPGNLMWLPERTGIQQVGLLDFQEGMMGPAPYDLVNLLDDARCVVPEPLYTNCMNRFVDKLKIADRDVFRAWYAVLACQFHCRVIGQAIKLSVREDKNRLLALIPVLQHHLRRDLHSVHLKPLAQWFKKQGVNFSENNVLDPAKIARFIRDDAF